jgi:hypothetical protein
MYLTYNTIDWTWCDTQATNGLTASILERKDCIVDQIAEFERLLGQSKSWNRRAKYRERLQELAGAKKELDALHGHILNVHHDNTREGADGEIKGTIHGTEKSVSYGGSK